jgi:arsenite-transporting ATPase
LAFYGGKGGVGKTTCAAARAVIEAAAGGRVLVVSTDPAHSLGDALAVRLSSSPRAIPGLVSRAGLPRIGRSKRSWGSLHAVELDAHRAFGRWLARHRAALGDALEHGTWLDRLDIEALLDLPLPGIDELVGLLEIARLAGIDAEPAATSRDRSWRDRGFENIRSSKTRVRYDRVVIDTAPTGHTLRLLASVGTVAAVAAVLDDLQEEHRFMRARFARAAGPDAADRVITTLAGQAQQIGAVLRDANRTAFHWVTLPEALSFAETHDAIAALEKSRMRIAEVIVNQLVPEGRRCPVCDARRRAERRVVVDLSRSLGRRHRLRLIPADVHEPRGVAALGRIGRVLADLPVQPARASRTAGDRATPPDARRRHSGSLRLAVNRPKRFALSLPKNAPATTAESLGAFRDASLLFIAGKGGVGKTTIAAAAALRLARADAGRPVLLLSTDPAHSLGDVLGLAAGIVGDAPGTIPGGPANLSVRELDAVKALAARRARFESALDDIVASFGAAPARHHGAELMDLAPPGIDELLGIVSVLEARAAFPRIVVDMAPTGHALRLLEEPRVGREWVQALLRMLLKYRSLVRPGRLAEELVAFSKSIRDLQALLNDASRTHVIVVTRAADLPRLETRRLIADLGRLNMAVPAIVVNALTLGSGACARCRVTAAVERTQLAALPPDRVIIQAPLSAPPPRGIAALERWGTRWTLGGAATGNPAARPRVARGRRQ